MHVQLCAVCTEFMLSVHRADCERATQPYSSGGGGVRFFQAQDQPSVTTHVRVGNRVFSHSLDVVSKMHIHIIYSHFFTWHFFTYALYSISKLPQEDLPRNSKVRITHCTPYDLRIAEGQ